MIEGDCSLTARPTSFPTSSPSYSPTSTPTTQPSMIETDDVNELDSLFGSLMPMLMVGMTVVAVIAFIMMVCLGIAWFAKLMSILCKKEPTAEIDAKSEVDFRAEL